MIVVSDTSPLNYLVQLGYPNLLQLVDQQIMVPLAVLAELQHAHAPEQVRGWAAAPPSWIRRVAIETLDGTLPPELGAGEREAISLALQYHADVVLLDERLGRREAEARNLAVTGTLAILLDASLAGHLSFPEQLARLRQLGFRCSAGLEATMLSRYRVLRKLQ